MIDNKKIALVLSGGASLGFAHVGVIKLLEENGIKPDIITGTSAGALIGGAYAMGMPIDEMEEKILDFHRNKIMDLKFVPFLGDSVLISKKIDKYLVSVFRNFKIEDSKIKFVATAVDMEKGKIKYFKRGLMWHAIRASISVPGVFNPFTIGNSKYIDGGVMDNLPTTIAKDLGADIIIAVNVIDYENALLEPRTLIHSLFNAITLSQKEIVRIKTKADLILNIKLKDVGMFAFKKEESIKSIQEGYLQSKRKLKDIKKLLGIDENN